ncbi:MAG: hypothetical protein N3E48_00210 [Candidatus Bathyarchaeota archaeon]|nr:hypothetical protein [Candidatus Bathyarchaeota archaeon]
MSVKPLTRVPLALGLIRFLGEIIAPVVVGLPGLLKDGVAVGMLLPLGLTLRKTVGCKCCFGDVLHMHSNIYSSC